MTYATSQSGDREAIVHTLNTYISGGISGKSSDMRPAFHDGATIHGYLGPDLIAGPIEGLFGWIDENGPATELKADISAVDICETIATARVECHNWGGHRFTDMFTLLKADGEWKIVSKVFYLHPEE
ncbi:MAG: nuclear transport factor 2 family protein [Acidobacteria bacterium]|nr:nuclear transport factor 2 family protein [Acidobacteriota bacterium]